MNLATETKGTPQAYANCRRYEYVTKLLIPASAEWTAQHWCNDMIALDSIKNLYHLDYLGHGQDLNRMYTLLFKVWRDNIAPTAREIVDLGLFSMELASLIWPEATEDRIVEAFLDIYEKREYTHTYCSYEKIKASGIYKLINDRFLDGSLTPQNRASVRKALYEIGIEV